MTIGKQIAELRKQYGLTQENVAEKCGVSRQAVTKWESNEVTPQIDNLIELADFLNVSLDYLIRGKDTIVEAKSSMNKKDTEIFMEVMGWVGDVWTQEQVEDCFEEMSLRDALETRIEAIHHIQDLVNAVVEDKE
jgi:transcriptional regulator with XRE-family HTH domain